MPEIVTKLPRPVREIENEWIVLADGCRLAARIWLPDDAPHAPVPAVLEYLPYRKRDGTAARDAEIHPYIAGHGYACVRVDMRGSGDSDGLLHDEYLPQEQDDAVEVIAWIAAQQWCSGRVGMIGISWGGFNGLQVAARRPPALAGVISLCSTDDRYADDVHFMGGALLMNNLTWGATMLAFMARPPDPAIVGARWREMWLNRMANEPQFAAMWLRHQCRDALWQHGSVCEDYAAITCPVYAVGGWADAYSNAIPRLLAGLRAPCKALIGPWAHGYPQVALPGPQIGFLQECLRWWDHCLAGHDAGMMAEPALRAWVLDSHRPATWSDAHPGGWVAEPCWPRADTPWRVLYLTAAGLAEAPAPDMAMLIASPEDCGAGAGAWCPYGLTPDLPTDQREDDAKSVVFDTIPLTAAMAILGAPVLTVALSADRPAAKLVVRLCEVHPDGASTRVSYGVLNLTHRNGHATPEPIVPGETMHLRLVLNDIGYRFAAGNRIRVALSSTYWPLTWPSPERTRLMLRAGSASIALPVRADTPADAKLPPFPPAEISPRAARTILRPGRVLRETSRDLGTGECRTITLDDTGRVRFDATGLEYGTIRRYLFRIHPDDPLSARAEARWENETGRGDTERDDWQTRTTTTVTMTATAREFVIDASLDAFEGERRVCSRNWHDVIPRDQG